MPELVTQNRIIREEMAELRSKNRTLREEIMRERPQALPVPVPEPLEQAEPNPPVHVPRGTARQILNDEGVLVHDFLKLQTLEFKEVGSEDPEEFLEETEKMIKRLPCSDSQVIELVGVNVIPR